MKFKLIIVVMLTLLLMSTSILILKIRPVEASSEETVVHYVESTIFEHTDSWNDSDPIFLTNYFSANFNMTFSPPDANGVINLTIPKEEYHIKLTYDPTVNTTIQAVPISDWYGKLYTVNGTGDVDITTMTNDTGSFFWKDGAWHTPGEEWIGDDTPDPAGSAWMTGMYNISVYQGNGTDGLLLLNGIDKRWRTTGFMENTVVEPASRLNGCYVNATGVPFSPPYVGTIGTFISADARLNAPYAGEHLDEQFKTNGLEMTPSPTPVGGIYIPVNKLELLAPYIGLTVLLAVAVITLGYVKKRKRDTEINS